MLSPHRLETSGAADDHGAHDAHSDHSDDDSESCSCSSCDSSSCCSSSGTPRHGSGAEEEKEKKQTLTQRLMPEFLYQHGRTVYGGNPVAQQTLPGIFTYVSPSIMIPIFFVFMIPFIVVGAAIVVRSDTIYLVDVEYSNIHRYQYLPDDPAVNINEGIRSFTAEGVTHRQGTTTWAEFTVTKTMKAPVYMYYRISNLYQNHRDFHDGRSTAQLKASKSIGSTYMCKPFVEPGYIDNRGADVVVQFNGQSKTASAFTYNPCGTAAWAMFNDTLALFQVRDDLPATDVLMGGADGTLPLRLVCNGTDFAPEGDPLGSSAHPNQCHKKGISWRADTDVRFKPLRPSEEWWSLRFPYATDNDYLNNGWYLHEPGHPLQDPVDLDFQVWMKSAVLSNFRKLYRVIDVDLEPGRYVLRVDEFFDVVSFDGTKHLVLRTGNWIGDSNVAIGVVFIVMGGLSFVMGVAFTIEFCLRRRGRSRLDKLPEPKRSWYLFDPLNPQFEKYFQLRMERHVPMAELVTLRKMQDESLSDEDVNNN